MSRRLLWQREVSRTAFDVGMRPVKATLLSIASLMTIDGRLEVWRDQLVDAAGVPPRTIDRHLDKAISAGWLRRTMPGGYKRRAVYVVTVPTSSPCAPLLAHRAAPDEPILCAMCSAQDGESCAPRCGELNTDSARVSEHGAVQDHDAAAEDVGTADTPTDRYGTAKTTRQAGTVFCHVVEAPPDHGSAERHDLTRRLRLAGLSPRRSAFVFRTGLAA